MSTKQRRHIKRSVVVFVGEKLAGKELAAKYLVTKYKYVGIRFSKILDDILQRMHLPVSRVNEMHLGSALRERFGESVLAEVIKREIELRKLKRVVVDGLRHMGEYEVLARLPGFVVVYLTAPLTVRYARARQRKEKVGEHKFSLQDFKREEKLVTELFIGKLGRKAKVKIINDGTVAQLHSKLEHDLIKRYF